MKTWSPYQNTIFNFIQHGEGNGLIVAVAGSGKSTTIVEGTRYAAGSCIMLAFNKSIADELKERGVNARTFHSLTFNPVLRHKGASVVTTDKLKRLCMEHLSGNEAFLYTNFLTRLVGLGRQSGIGCLIHDTDANWISLVDQHELELDHEGAELGRAIELASSLLQWSNESNMVDFDDMLYLSVKDGLSLPKFDFVFVDEAQDTNAIQRAILRKIMHPRSRLIAVGDPAQAIYGFRGADSNSLNLIKEEFDCKELPLTVSYRCPRSVVSFAKQWVEHIEHSDTAAEGHVENLNDDWNVHTFEAGDLVVCRTTKPIIQLAFKLIRSQVPACVMGKEIGQGLKSLIHKMKVNDVTQLQIKLDKWCDREVEKAVARGQEERVEALQDKVACITAIIEGLSEDEHTLQGIDAAITKLFSDSKDAVQLATIHKSKGLEARTVYWLNSSKCPSSWAKQPWQKQQEYNLCYVAATRAQERLFMIEM